MINEGSEATWLEMVRLTVQGSKLSIDSQDMNSWQMPKLKPHVVGNGYARHIPITRSLCSKACWKVVRLTKVSYWCPFILSPMCYFECSALAPLPLNRLMMRRMHLRFYKLKSNWQSDMAIIGIIPLLDNQLSNALSRSSTDRTFVEILKYQHPRLQLVRPYYVYGVPCFNDCHTFNFIRPCAHTCEL